MNARTLTCLTALMICIGIARSPANAGDARLLHYPSIHKDFVVFVHAGDIWRAAAGGGAARRLTSHRGLELTPKISPDGQWVAYSAE